MGVDEIYNEVANSKKYRYIYPDTVLRICTEESAKYKKKNDIVKSVKNKLHIISGSFFKDAELVSQILDGIETSGADSLNLDELAAGTAKAHSSLFERADFYNEFYDDILCRCNNPKIIMDAACGLNPIFFAVYAKKARFDFDKIYACDINLKALELVNRAGKILGANIEAFPADLFTEVPKAKADLAFLFKIAPILETQKKGYLKTVIEGINANRTAVSFPTKSMTGKSKGMLKNYSDFFNSFSERCGYKIIFEKAYPGELLFLIEV